MIQNILFNNLKNKPDMMTAADILIKDGNVRYDPVSGAISVLQVRLQNYFDTALKLKTTPSLIPEDIKIIGFKRVNTPSTVLPTTPVPVPEVSWILPYKVEHDVNLQTQVKLAILNKTTGLPSGITTENVIINSYNPININGELLVSGYLNYFVDSTGVVHLPTSPDQSSFTNIKLTGFAQTRETTGIKDVTLPSTIGLAYTTNEASDTELLKKIIVQNKELFFDNIPDNFAAENIVNLRVTGTRHSLGTMTIDMTINRYFKKSTNITYIDGSETYEDNGITISGFKPVTATSLAKTATAPVNFLNVIPSEFNDVEELKSRVIIPQMHEIILNTPIGFNDKNITSVRIGKKDNLSGTVQAYVTINLLYDNSGATIKRSTELGPITINGFQMNNPTSYPTVVELPSDIYGTLLAQDVDEAMLKQIILDNRPKFFDPVPPNFAITDVTLNSDSYNNEKGTIRGRISFKNWFAAPDSRIEPSIVTYDVNISGFRKVKQTIINNTADISATAEWSNVYASSVVTNKTQLQGFVSSAKDLIFQNLPDDFIVSNNVKIDVVDSNNIKGTMTLGLTLNKYYSNDSKKTLIQTDFNASNAYRKNIEISGFKNVQPTKIKDSFTFGANAYSDILPSLITSDMLRDILWSFRNEYIENLPENFSQNDMFFNFSEAYPNNLNGTISLTINLTRYYSKSTGELILPNVGLSSPMSQSVTIGGFKSIAGPTSIVSSLDVTSLFPPDALPRPSEMTPSELVNLLLISKGSITNLPENFNVTNIKIIPSTIEVNNLNGFLYATVQINKYYDNTGLLHNDENGWIPFPVKFYGFKHQQPTEVQSVISLPEFKNKKASDFSKEEILAALRQNYLTKPYDFITNLPDGFVPENIKMFNFSGAVNNKLGQISGIITIDKFYNKQGVLNKPGEYLEVSVLLIDFQVVGQTYANNLITLNEFNDQLPTLVKNEDIENSIYANRDNIYSNLPAGISKDQLQISIESKSNKTGVVSARLTLYKYYNKNGALVDTTDITAAYVTPITIKGFKKALPTSAVDSFHVLGFNDTLPSDVDTTVLSQYIWENRTLLLQNIPDSLKQSQMNVSVVEALNKEGSLVIKLSLNTYYDDDSNVVEDSASTRVFQITLYGFKTAEPTQIVPSVTIQGISDKATTDVTNDYLKNIIFINKNLIFLNLVDNKLTLDDFSINIIPGASDPKTGIIKAQLTLYKYYNEDGNIGNTSTPMEKEITIKGFKTISPSIISTTATVTKLKPTTVASLGDPNDYVDLGASDKKLKDLIELLKPQIFDKMPPDFDLSKDLVDAFAPKSDNLYCNLNGNLVVTLSIKNYYDRDAILQTVNPYTTKIYISGFTKTIPTSISQNIYVDDPVLSKKMAQDIVENDLLKFLKSNIGADKGIFFYTPKTFTADSIKSIHIDGFNNKNGTVSATVVLSTYNDETGIEVINGDKAFRVSFNNFTKTTPTLINFMEIKGKDTVITVPAGNSEIEPGRFQAGTADTKEPPFTSEELKEQYSILTKAVQEMVVSYSSIPRFDADGNALTPTVTINNYIDTSANNQEGSIRVQATVTNFINNKYEFVDSQQIILEITGFEVTNSFKFNAENETFKYTMFIISIVTGIVLIGCLIVFFSMYRKKRGLK